MAFPPTPPYGPSMISSFFATRMSYSDAQDDIFRLINQFQMIFDHIPAKVILTEVIDEHTFRYVPLHQVSQESEHFDLEGKILTEIFPQTALEQVKEFYKECLATQSLIEREIELCNDNGEAYRWLLCFVVPLFNEQESLTHMMLVSYDVTLRKQRELREQQEKIAQLVQLSNDLVERSLPVLALSTCSVLLPVIGPLEATHESLIQARLQELAGEQSLEYVVLDLTGVPADDPSLPAMLATLVRLAATLQLKLIITGLDRATAAQVQAIEPPFEQVQICKDLQAALQIIKRQSAS